MQVLSAPLRALLFCFHFFFGKMSHRKSSFSALLKYKIQDVTPYAARCDPLCCCCAAGTVTLT